ncbi:MAG: 4-hydroxyphenylpyruvate dioxygenase [bacterium]
MEAGTSSDPESIESVDSAHPSSLRGIEFIEYATARPLALGHVLELMGFRPVARHRSREVLLYRQGTMNVVINAHGVAPHPGAPLDDVRISAVAFRARDAAAAYRRALDRGGWSVPTRVEAMELNIPAIHGVGASRIYFVDRYREFSIYTVDFVPIPCVDQQPPAIAGMRWFGLVQQIGAGRTNDWTAFYRELFGFLPIPDELRFGVRPEGRILCSPCRTFYLQLIEHRHEHEHGVGPAPRVEERLSRLGLGTSDVVEAVHALRARGVEFVDAAAAGPAERGALTRGLPDGVSFELVRDQRPLPSPS